jgi:spore germination protein YaaH
VANERRSGYWRATFVAAAMIGLSACNPTRFVSGWVPYWTAPEGRVAFSNPQASTMFSDVSPFFFSALPDGTIGLVGSENQLKLTVDAAHAQGLQVLPSITDGSGQWMMATAILANTSGRAQHVQNIVNLVLARGFDGIDLDYEGFAFADGQASWVTTQPVWIAFVTDLAAALHANNKLLSVTIPPTWIDAPNVLRGYWVYSPQQIGAVADRVRLMVYDWSVGSPGSISPMSWVNRVIAYNDPLVPNNKLQLGVPSYGRNWGRQVNPNEICPDGALRTTSIELQNMPALIAAHGASPSRLDPVTLGEMYFSYDVIETGYSTTPIKAPPYVPPTHVVATVGEPATGATTGLQPALRLTPPTTQQSCTVRHFVYYPDAATIQLHAQAALTAGWSGVVIWALGYETADVYTALGNTTP